MKDKLEEVTLDLQIMKEELSEAASRSRSNIGVFIRSSKRV